MKKRKFYRKIEFYKHNLSSKDKQRCLDVLNSLFLTTGKEVKLFEKKFASYLNIEYVLGVTSCTDALFLALKGLDIKEGDEVITTPLTFIATANVIEYCNAKVIFVDVEKETGNIDANLIERAITSRTRAIIVVHLYGQMCDMKKIKKIAQKHNLKIIEDCAHCIEGIREGVRVGELGDISCFSFYAVKNITSGEGGAIACHDKKIYEWLYRARLHGMSKSAADRYSKKYEHYDMDILGYKCNMSNIQASLLINQLDNIEKFLERKESIAQKYSESFSKNPKISIPQVFPNSKHARHLYTIWVSPERRDYYLHYLQGKGIGVAVNFRPVHYMTYYQKKYKFKKGDFPNAEMIGDSTISIPLYPKLKDKEVGYVLNTINEMVG